MFEREARISGVMVQEYSCDNGVFTSVRFQSHLDQMQQGQRVCGVSAHNQNAVAERSIRTMFSIARAQLLHAML